jgi:hypothetical protein
MAISYDDYIAALHSIKQAMLPFSMPEMPQTDPSQLPSDMVTPEFAPSGYSPPPPFIPPQGIGDLKVADQAQQDQLAARALTDQETQQGQAELTPEQKNVLQAQIIAGGRPLGDVVAKRDFNAQFGTPGSQYLGIPEQSPKPAPAPEVIPPLGRTQCSSPLSPR